MTPEGKVKHEIKKALESLGIFPASKAGLFPEDAQGWYYMPVSYGAGVHGIPDFVGHVRGRAFYIESKAPGRKPTPLQELQLRAIRQTGALAFVVSSQEDIGFMCECLQK